MENIIEHKGKKQQMSGWNYRVMAHEHKGEIYFQIHDVYYNKKRKPNSYTRDPSWVGSETIEGMQWTLDAMKEALSKPILWAGHKFPLEYKQNP